MIFIDYIICLIRYLYLVKIRKKYGDIDYKTFKQRLIWNIQAKKRIKEIKERKRWGGPSYD